MPNELLALAQAIARRDPAVVGRLREAARDVFTGDHFLEEIQHYVYGGDTLLHVAAAAYATEAARALLAAGAGVRARNRRGAEPLHYASDGNPALATWDPAAQAEMVALLVEAGAEPDALDKGGVAPLHRAVRTRSTGAVGALLAAGADPELRNKSGSTPLALASMTTGRGGSGEEAASREQEAIVRLLRR